MLGRPETEISFDYIVEELVGIVSQEKGTAYYREKFVEIAGYRSFCVEKISYFAGDRRGESYTSVDVRQGEDRTRDLDNLHMMLAESLDNGVVYCRMDIDRVSEEWEGYYDRTGRLIEISVDFQTLVADGSDFMPMAEIEFEEGSLTCRIDLDGGKTYSDKMTTELPRQGEIKLLRLRKNQDNKNLVDLFLGLTIQRENLDLRLWRSDSSEVKLVSLPMKWPIDFQAMRRGSPLAMLNTPTKDFRVRYFDAGRA